MKLILIIFDADKEEILHEILDRSGVPGFTTWSPVYGKGRHSDPRMGTQVWPGENAILLTAISEEMAETLRANLLSHEEMKTGVKVFELSSDEWL